MKILFCCVQGQSHKVTKIQTQKGSNERLFILTRTHIIKFSGKSPLSSHKRTIKQQINGQKRRKMKEKDLLKTYFVLYFQAP